MKNTWFTVHKVHPLIYALAECCHWEKVVSYLIVDKKRAFLVDTGMGYWSIKSVIKQITKLPITVLLTHTHWDHIGSVWEFDDVYVFDDKYEKKQLKRGFNSSQIKNLSEEKFFSCGFSPKIYSVQGKQKFNLFYNKSMIKSDSFGIKVLHTPGHTPGSVCFYIRKYHLLFTGDTIYPGPLLAQLPESNFTLYKKSIKRLSQVYSRQLYLFPGHNSVKEQSNLLREIIEGFSQITSSEKKRHDFNSFSVLLK